MAAPSPRDITELLLEWRGGDIAALDRLVPLVYAELRRLARRAMTRERAGHDLQTTALIHEAYMRLVDSSRVHWQSRAHFYAVSAQLMRRILVDFARARGSRKRGGGVQPLELREGMAVAPGEERPDLVALDEALETLAAQDARKSRVVELRFFGGLSVEETAEALGVSRRTVLREWSLAQAWLHRALRAKAADGD